MHRNSPNINEFQNQTVKDESEAPEESFGFHLQQAVEKATKAWIAGLGGQYPLTDGIETLLRRLEALSMDMAPFEGLAEFTPYAVRFRYEGAVRKPNPSIARR